MAASLVRHKDGYRRNVRPVLLKKMSQPGSFQAMLVQFNCYQDPDTSAGLLWYSKSNNAGNFTSYSNLAVDRLVGSGKEHVGFQREKGHLSENAWHDCPGRSRGISLL